MKGGWRVPVGVRFNLRTHSHFVCVYLRILLLPLRVSGLVFAEVMKVAGLMWRLVPAHEKAVGCKERRESR